MSWLDSFRPKKESPVPKVDPADLRAGFEFKLQDDLADFEADGAAFKALAAKVSELVGGAVIAQTPSGSLFHPKFLEELNRPGNERLRDFGVYIQKMGS